MTLISNRDSSPTGQGTVVVEMEESLVSKHPDLHRLLGYYQARRRADGVLPRSAVQPRDLVALLPSLFIADTMRGGDWRFRLVGTGLVDRLGTDFTGKTVRAVYNRESAAWITGLYQRVAHDRRSILCRGRVLGLNIDYLRGECLQVPLLGVDGRTIMVFGGLFFL